MGGGGDSSTPPVESATTVTAVDGYIKNAVVKDTTGLTATYSDNGKYIFSKTPTYPLTLTGGVLEDVNILFDINMTAQSGSSVISPITTFLGNDSNLLSKLANLGLGQTTLDEFNVDYIESSDIDLAKLSQLLYIILKDSNLTTTFKQSLENNDSIYNLDMLFDLASSDINASNWINAQKNCANTLLTKIKTFNSDPSTIETYLKDEKTLFSQGCQNNAPVAIDGSIDGQGVSSKTFSMADVISDAENSDSELTIIITQQSSKGTITINGVNATFDMNSGSSGDSYFLFKVQDPEGALSEEKRFDLINFDN